MCVWVGIGVGTLGSISSSCKIVKRNFVQKLNSNNNNNRKKSLNDKMNFP